MKTGVMFVCLQAVDVVGQAGKPKAITGFQTHTTPVLLAHGERAELATEEYLPVTPILEGFVILRKNPSYDAQGPPRACTLSKALPVPLLVYLPAKHFCLFCYLFCKRLKQKKLKNCGQTSVFMQINLAWYPGKQLFSLL